VAVAIVRVPNHVERKDNCGVRMKTGWSGRIGQLAEVALDDLAGFQRVRVNDPLSVLDRRSWARYLVVPDWW